MSRAPLDSATSHFLDLSRIVAAFVVVLHHVFEPPFHAGSVGFPGRSAVIVFFVISGFVIAFSTEGQLDWRRYATARLARIYSVAVPSLLLAALLLAMQNRLPGVTPAAVDMPLLRVGVSVVFANQFWNLTVSALTNGPYWSLCYEVWYYVLFGVLTFMRGWHRLLAAAALVVMVGPRILLLLPVWALGVITFRAMQRRRLTAPGLERALFWLCSGLLVLAMAAGTPLDPISARIRDSLPDGYFRLGPISAFIGGDARFLSDWLLGLLFAACIFLSRRDHPVTTQLAPLKSVVKVCSSYTFSLYLYHVPVLVFAHAVLSPRLTAAVVPWVMLLTILLVTAVLGRYTEHRKEPWVRAFNAMLGRQARSSA